MKTEQIRETHELLFIPKIPVMIYKDYQDAIFKLYEARKNANGLSLNLRHPSPSKIRDECIIVYRSRFGKKDIATLTSFFEVDKEAALPKTMQRFEIDKFRPLVNYLKKMTADTEWKNVELLAWLLGFEPRPYDKHYDYTKIFISNTENTPVEVPEVTPEERGNDESDGFPKPANMPLQTESIGNNETRLKSPGFIKRVRVIVGGVIVASGLFAALHFNNKDDKGCMIWVNDHYEKVSCDSSGGAMGLVLGLDAGSVRHLRRITRPDTLTEKDIGRVWYRRRGGDSLDFYTTGGRDPVDPNLDLKRLTTYIFEKYLKKNK